ncbi:spore coat protein GerQ [Thalassobacillus hwangdonensis]|uniref:Spore coat protein GerQ n=1 Tax=Thalassobacillus hwangdonensis TaxID=546108 RepID=A0ABW3L629_9BACI
MSQKNNGYQSGTPQQGQPYYQQQNPYQYYYPQSQMQSPQSYVQGAQQQPMVPQMPSAQQPSQNIPGMLPVEESYIENILRLNRGKEATVYMTFENNDQWNAKIFKGIIEAAGRDHIILSDPETGKRYLLLMIYLDYITFDEEINYSYPFNNTGQMSNYSNR